MAPSPVEEDSLFRLARVVRIYIHGDDRLTRRCATSMKRHLNIVIGQEQNTSIIMREIIEGLTHLLVIVMHIERS